MNHLKSSNHVQIHSAKQQQGLMLISFLLLVIIIALVVFLAMYTYKLNGEVVSKFENRRWDIPATVYSRPLVLAKGASIDGETLETWLGMLNYSEGDIQKTGSYQKTGNTYTVHVRGFDYGDGDIEQEQVIKITFGAGGIQGLQSSVPNDKGVIRLEPVNIGGIYPENNEDRILLTKDTIPQTLVDALVATEDRTFYEHYGISFRGTMRALLSNITGGERQGGSTITQQLIKNFYLTQERTLKRKVNEAIMALLLERHYSKNDILLAYLNEINLGQNGNRSVNGFAIASQFYFNKPLKELSVDQYALLVGVAKGSSFYNPRKNPERALDRRNTVLNNMLVMGKIDQKTYDDAIKEPLGVVETPSIAKSKFPDFFDVVNRELKRYYQEKDLRSAGLKIISTLDPIAQLSADRAMANQLPKLKKSNKATGSLQGALVSADPKTGELVAIVGSASEFTGFNRAIDAKRQVGSILKPVIYLTALQSGKYNLASAVHDAPVAYRSGGKDWTPKNYSNQSYGDVPLMTALANSYNQAAVNVGMEFGMNTFVKQVRQLGIEKPMPDYPSTLLGAVDLSPMDMLGMYQVFASGGYHTPIHSVSQVISEKGKVLQRVNDDIKTTPRIPPEAMYLANFGLQQVMKDGTAKSAGKLAETYKLAGKTGTTNDARDAWFAGFSGNYVSVVWVGRDDNKPIGLTGGSGALPIWLDYMKRLDLSPVNFDKPKGVEWLWVEQGTGLLSDQACADAVYIPVLSKYAPKELGACLGGVDEMIDEGVGVADKELSADPDVMPDENVGPNFNQSTKINKKQETAPDENAANYDETGEGF